SLHEINQRFIRDDNGIIDDAVLALVSGSDGCEYAFGRTSGKIWIRTQLGVWELLGVVSPVYLEDPEDDGSAVLNGEPGIYDAIEADGYIYYTTRRTLGRFKIGEDFASHNNDSFGQFENADPDF